MDQQLEGKEQAQVKRVVPAQQPQEKIVATGILPAKEPSVVVVGAKSSEESKNKGTKGIVAELLEKKVVSEDQIEIALKERENLNNSKTVAAILVDMGFISEGALSEILSESTGVKKFDIKSSIIDSRLVRKVPKEFSIHNKLIPISFSHCLKNGSA